MISNSVPETQYNIDTHSLSSQSLISLKNLSGFDQWPNNWWYEVVKIFIKNNNFGIGAGVSWYVATDWPISNIWYLQGLLSISIILSTIQITQWSRWLDGLRTDRCHCRSVVKQFYFENTAACHPGPSYQQEFAQSSWKIFFRKIK